MWKKACSILLIIVNLVYNAPHINADNSNADATNTSKQCNQFASTGYFFGNHESHEYVNGLLVLHLNILPDYDDGRQWGNGFNLYKPDCTYDFIQNPAGAMSLPMHLQQYSLRFTSPTHFDFWDDEKDQKLICPSCAMDVPQVSGDGSKYVGLSFHGFIDNYASYVNSATYPVVDNAAPPKEPVLIIPGILGSQLNSQDQVIWPNLGKMLLDPADSFLDHLSLDQYGRPAVDPYVFPTKVIDKIDYAFGQFHYTDSLVNDFVNQGYVPDQNLFLFSYDWRLNMSDIAVKLRQKIQDILLGTGALKINIIAHSMGGLVLKEFLLDVSNDTTFDENKIGKIIFVAVPNLGSAEAAKILIFGSNLNIPLLNPDEINNLAQNMPSIYEMLPTEEYYKNTAGYYDDLTDPQIPGILDYAQSKQFLLNLGKNKNMLEAAEVMHSQALDNFDFSTKPYSAYNIVGCGTFTLKTIDKMYTGDPGLIKRLLQGPKYRIYSDSGDGTVLINSAAHLNIPATNTFYVKGAMHAEMLSADGARQLITGILGGQPVMSAAISNNAQNCFVQGKLVSFDSDVEFSIKNIATGQILDNSKFIQEKTGENSHVFLPEDGNNYQVIIHPGNAEKNTAVKFSLTKISQNKTIITNYNNVPIVNKVIQINNDGRAQTLDNNGASQDLVPDSVLDNGQSDDPTQAIDITPPIADQAPAAVSAVPVSSVPVAPVVSPVASIDVSPASSDQRDSSGTDLQQQRSGNTVLPSDNQNEESNQNESTVLDQNSTPQDGSTPGQNSSNNLEMPGIADNDSANNNAVPLGQSVTPDPINITLHLPEPKIIYINGIGSGNNVQNGQGSAQPVVNNSVKVDAQNLFSFWNLFKNIYNFLHLSTRLIFF